jgi:hypothetical protein
VTADGQPLRYGYFRFDVSVPADVLITAAEFRCFVGRSWSGATLWPTSSDWSEQDITWSTAPLPDFSRAPLGTLSGPDAQGYVSADVTGPVVGSGTYSLVTTTDSTQACNDGHDCGLATADAWLASWLPVLMSGPDYAGGHLTIVITFDEDDGTMGNQVPLVAIDPRLVAKVVTGTFDHYSLTRWLDDNAGVPPLRNAASAPDLRAAFGL